MRVPIGLSVLAAAIATAASSAQTSSNVGDVLARVGDRIAEYYKRAQTVICVETYSVQPIGRDWGSAGLARVTESELRVELEATDGDGSGDAKVVRELRKVNGRVPRERDKKGRDGCTDMNPLSPEPLSFLLPARREEYHFVAVAAGKGRDTKSLVIDFRTAAPRTKIELIEDKLGRPDCFDFTGTLPKKGRVWVDAATYDVLRVEEQTIGPVDVRVPFPLQRKYMPLDDPVVVEREDMSIRYKKVTFRDPDEDVLLPESIVQLIVVRGGLQSTRRTHSFTDYRRFVTGARLVK
jgi:hypothetical protein